MVDAATNFIQISILIFSLSIVVLSATYIKTTRPSGREALFLTFVLACLPLAKATQWAWSDDATVLPDEYISESVTPDPQIVIAQAFKSHYRNDVTPSPFNSGFRIDLKSSVTVTMVFVQNFSKDEYSY